MLKRRVLTALGTHKPGDFTARREPNDGGW